MASPLNTLKEEHLSCQICFEHYKQPKALDCLHSFCKKCLISHVTKNHGNQQCFPCPICRQETVLPDTGIEGLRDNFFISNIQEHLHFLPGDVGDEESTPKRDGNDETVDAKEEELCLDEEQGHKYDEGESQEEGKCVLNLADKNAKPDNQFETSTNSVCDCCLYQNIQSTAINFCPNCEELLCKSCTTYHYSAKATRGHKVHSILDTNASINSQPLKISHCELHKCETLKLFCLVCRVCICVECKITTHDEHKTAHIKEIIDVEKKGLQELLENSIKKRQQLEEVRQSVEDNNLEDAAHANMAVSQINTRFKELASILQEHQEWLVSKVQERRSDREKIFFNVIENIQEKIGENSNTCQEVNELLQMEAVKVLNERDRKQKAMCDLLQIKAPECPKVIHPQFCKLISEKCGTILKNWFVPVLELSATFTVELNPDEVIWRLLKMKGGCIIFSVYNHKNPNLSRGLTLNANGKVAEVVGMGGVKGIEDINDELVASTQNGIISFVTNVECIMRMKDSSTGELTKHLKQLCLMDIALTSHDQLVGIRHGFLVTSYTFDDTKKVWNQTSTFQHKRASANANKLSDASIVCNKSHQDDIIISDWNDKKVYIYSSEGKLKYLYTGATESFQPEGVCIDSTGDIILADSAGHKLHLLTPCGELKGYLLTTDDGIKQPWAVHFTQDNQLLVGHSKNKISVYNYIK